MKIVHQARVCCDQLTFTEPTDQGIVKVIGLIYYLLLNLLPITVLGKFPTTY
jgi:hypothetical protein